MKKRIFTFILSLIIFSSSFFNSYASDVFVSAESAVLMCFNDGNVLFCKNEHRKMPVASTTKILTSLIALECATPHREITVTDEMISVEGTSMGLKEGDRVSLLELVYGMMLQSGNDAANSVAYAIGGSPEKFSELMNMRAEKIGMNNSNFVTASGLDDDNHYSTAYDMALLACESMKNPMFRSVCSNKTSAVSYGNPPYSRVLTNHNKLLWQYPDCIGIKTGFTKKSGRCLVSAAERDGIILVAVTLNAPDDWNDHVSMFEYGFSEYGSKKVLCGFDNLSLRIFAGDRDYIPLKLYRDGYIPENSVCYCRINIRPYDYAPVEKGKIVGYAYFTTENGVVDKIPIVTDGSSSRKKNDLLNNIKKYEDNKIPLFNKLMNFITNAFCQGVQR